MKTMKTTKTIAKVEIATNDDGSRGRIVRIPIKAVSVEEGTRAMQEASKTMKEHEWIYQVCAPCRNCKLDQPFWDYFNGFHLLGAAFWQEHLKKGLTIKQRFARIFV